MSRPQFSDDNPKENPWTEDRLGFAPFAKRLSESILEVNAPNGYVIGLQGPWGSGKSTALNFVQAFIKKYNDELPEEKKSVHIIDFRPWIVSGHQDLIESFFKIITEQLADQKDAWSKRRKAGLRSLRKNVDPLVDATAAIGSILAPGIGTLSGIGIKLAAETAKKSGSSKLDDWLAEPSLQSAYDKLRSKIVEQGEKILVIIDDIDRLAQEEIRTIMQMVKTLGRLPHVVYLLAYDRNIVWPALDALNNRSEGGPSFAEKIIQQEIELPNPTKKALFALLDSEIGFLTSSVAQNDRWYRIVMDGVQHWIKHPRDVARLANAVKFTWPAIEGEVDRQDVLAIEGIRLFDPVLFHWIRANRRYFFGSEDWTMSTDHGKEKVCNEFLALAPEAEHERWARLLCLIIPSMHQIFEKKRGFFGLMAEAYPATSNRRGIGSEAGYTSYFSLHPSPNAVPVQTIDLLLDSDTSTQEIVDVLGSMLVAREDQDNPLIGECIQDIRNRIYAENYKIIPENLLSALLKIGGAIQRIDQKNEIFQLSPSSNLEFLLGEICKLTNEHRLARLLYDAFDSMNSLGFFSEFWVWRAEETGLLPREGRGKEPIIKEDLLRQLHSVLVRNFEDAISDRSIYDLPFYFHILKVWGYEDREDRVKNWISETSKANPTFLAKICLGLLSYSVGSNPKMYSMHTEPNKKFFDTDSMLAAAKMHCDNTSLSDDERRRITALMKGIENIRKSRPDSFDLYSQQTE